MGSTHDVYFFRYLVNKQVFFRSRLTYALVNLKPLVPGHVLVVPLRTSVLRFSDLTPDESIDYMNTLQLIHKFVIKHYKADSLNIAIQDGPELGQLIPHLHTHIIPRYKTDGFGDSIYEKLEKSDLDTRYQDFEKRKQIAIQVREQQETNELNQDDSQRIERLGDVMAEEAKELAKALTSFIDEDGATDKFANITRHQEHHHQHSNSSSNSNSNSSKNIA